MDQRARKALAAATSVAAVTGLALAFSKGALAPGGRDSAPSLGTGREWIASTVSPPSMASAPSVPTTTISPSTTTSTSPTSTVPTSADPATSTGPSHDEVATAGAAASDYQAPPPQVPAGSGNSTSTSASSGGLRATLTATRGSGPQSMSFAFVLLVADSSSTGPIGPTSLTYGDGQPVPETGLPASCSATISSASTQESFDYSHSYAAPGTYDVSVTVASPCSSQQVVLALPVTVAAS